MVADQSELPIDRGWAWLVVLGYFVSIFCMAGLGRSFGIFMEEFEGYFDTSVAMAALVMGVYGGVYTLTAPVCVAAGEKFSQRRVVMVGGVIGALGLCLGGLLLSIEWVIVIIGVLFGMGNASIFGNGLVMINQYFDKRRSLANGISLSGASIGQFVIPPLLQFLLDRYSLQGTLIIVGGMYLHVSVCGALYRPLSAYKKDLRRDNLIQDLEDENMRSNESQHLAKIETSAINDTHQDIAGFLHKPRNYSLEQAAVTRFLKKTDDITLKGEVVAKENGFNLVKEYNCSYVIAEIHKEDVAAEYEKHTSNTNQENDQEEVVLDQNDLEQNDLDQNDIELNNLVHNVLERNDLEQNTRYIQAQQYSACEHKAEAAATESETLITFQVDNGAAVISSINSINSDVFSKTGECKKSYDKQTSSISNTLKSCGTLLSDLFDFSVVRNHVVILFVIVSFLFFFGHFNFILFMPPAAYQRGLSKYQKAYLVSISGLCDLLGRLSVGALGDLKFVPRYKLLALSTGLCGVMMFCFSFAHTFLTMAICCGLYGFFGGGYVTINVPTLIDFVGLRLMPKVLGVVLFIQGIGAAIGQPLLGSIRDITGSYKVVHMVNGLVMTSGALLLLLYPVVKKFATRGL